MINLKRWLLWCALVTLIFATSCNYCEAIDEAVIAADETVVSPETIKLITRLKIIQSNCHNQGDLEAIRKMIIFIRRLHK